MLVITLQTNTYQAKLYAHGEEGLGYNWGSIKHKSLLSLPTRIVTLSSCLGIPSLTIIRYSFHSTLNLLLYFNKIRIKRKLRYVLMSKGFILV